MSEATRIVREVADSDGLNALYPEYLGLLAEGRERVLEIVLAPGEYGVASCGKISLTLKGSPPPKNRIIDLVIRSASADEPAVLADMGVDIDARAVTLQDLVLAHRCHDSVLKVRFGGQLSLRGCAFVGHQLQAPFGGTLLELAELYEHGPSSVAIEDCWFVGNRAIDPGGLIAVAAASRSALRAVSFARCTFLDNAFPLDLAVIGASEVSFHACTVQRTPDPASPDWPGGRAAFTQVIPQDAPVTYDDCLLVLERLSDLGGNPTKLFDGQVRVAEATGVELPLTMQHAGTGIRAIAHDDGVAGGLSALGAGLGMTRLPDPATVRQQVLDLVEG